MHGVLKQVVVHTMLVLRLLLPVSKGLAVRGYAWRCKQGLNIPVSIQVEHAQQQASKDSREGCDVVVLSCQPYQQRTGLHS